LSRGGRPDRPELSEELGELDAFSEALFRASAPVHVPTVKVKIADGG
jgi:hypothetical protein